MAKSESSYLLVAAFDFGTTYSGYAFSFRNDPLKVQTNQNWVAGSEKLISLKTPTCVLLTPQGKFDSFGFEAENKYGNLAEAEEHEGWLFFRRFKMLLHNNERLSRSTTVEDINGKSMTAMTIFSMSIRYLRDHLLNELNKQTTGVEETDIQYVITVPAIWDDSAKQFMREAAVEAGLDTNRLKLSLEPEAASIWCQLLTTEAKGALSGTGTQYMVIDLGGGTADISVQEKCKDGTLKELHKASGGPWGGMYVDIDYLTFLEQLFGKKAMDKHKQEDMADYFDVLREFETKKRTIRSDTKDPVTFRISASLKEISEKKEEITIEDKLESMQMGKRIIIRRDKMRIDPSLVRSWFDKPIDNVIRHVQNILSEPKMSRISCILLVGGFGESEYVQEKIRNGIRTKRIIIPNEAGLAVVKGAVRFGHEPNTVSERVIGFTYGISTNRKFNEANDSPSLMVMMNGEKRVTNVFTAFIRCEDSVLIGHEEKRTYTPLYKDTTDLIIFCSPDPYPVYTTDPGCKLLGQLQISHPEGETLQDKTFDVIFIFGDTEITVKARIIKTGREFFTSVDCLK